MVADTMAMPAVRTEQSSEIVISGVTPETAGAEMLKSGIRPGQKVEVRIFNPWDAFFTIADRVSDRAEKLGLTEKKLEELLEE